VKTSDAKKRRIHACEVEHAHSAEAISDGRHPSGVDFRQISRGAKPPKKSRLQKVAIVLEGLHQPIRIFSVRACDPGAIDIEGESGIAETRESDRSLFLKTLGALHCVVYDDDARPWLGPFVVPGEFASQGMTVMVVVDRSDARGHFGIPSLTGSIAYYDRRNQ
jgi:hypothetical protein